MYLVLLFVCDVAVLYSQGGPQTFSFACLSASVLHALGLQASYHFLLRQGLTMELWLAPNSLCRPGSLRTHRDPSAPLLSAGAEGVLPYA